MKAVGVVPLDGLVLGRESAAVGADDGFGVPSVLLGSPVISSLGRHNNQF